MPELTKDDLLSNLYYDLDKGYGSAQSLYKQAQEEDINISLEYVKNWIKKQPNKHLQKYIFNDLLNNVHFENNNFTIKKQDILKENVY